eukprot:TRINITY_DN49427_c0_g1_i1.p1 TRINITY_DN49427_c0_g1~~TRINITY_DN49427_c0_g1_i1.p1  ORF type:complete len:828 (+),score=133.46 TRINITY_DN49427_c0_g1_i1:342-2486(+)
MAAAAAVAAGSLASACAEAAALAGSMAARIAEIRERRTHVGRHGSLMDLHAARNTADPSRKVFGTRSCEELIRRNPQEASDAPENRADTDGLEPTDVSALKKMPDEFTSKTPMTSLVPMKVGDADQSIEIEANAANSLVTKLTAARGNSNTRDRDSGHCPRSPEAVFRSVSAHAKVYLRSREMEVASESSFCGHEALQQPMSPTASCGSVGPRFSRVDEDHGLLDGDTKGIKLGRARYQVDDTFRSPSSSSSCSSPAKYRISRSSGASLESISLTRARSQFNRTTTSAEAWTWQSTRASIPSASVVMPRAAAVTTDRSDDTIRYRVVAPGCRTPPAQTRGSIDHANTGEREASTCGVEGSICSLASSADGDGGGASSSQTLRTMCVQKVVSAPCVGIPNRSRGYVRPAASSGRNTPATPQVGGTGSLSSFSGAVNFRRGSPSGSATVGYPEESRHFIGQRCSGGAPEVSSVRVGARSVCNSRCTKRRAVSAKSESPSKAPWPTSLGRSSARSQRTDEEQGSKVVPARRVITPLRCAQRAAGGGAGAVGGVASGSGGGAGGVASGGGGGGATVDSVAFGSSTGVCAMVGDQRPASVSARLSVGGEGSSSVGVGGMNVATKALVSPKAFSRRGSPLMHRAMGSVRRGSAVASTSGDASRATNTRFSASHALQPQPQQQSQAKSQAQRTPIRSTPRLNTAALAEARLKKHQQVVVAS